MTAQTFVRRGVVEGFFGPLWTMSHRKRLFEFGAAKGMNTYLYAPKDDPYHRVRWTEPYPHGGWQALVKLVRQAQRCGIDFVYGFHPGSGLCFSADQPLKTLLEKAGRFYEAGVRTFAVLFDDIPARLEHASDRRVFNNSLARAEGTWLAKIRALQPPQWRDVEWWICPSYYSSDPILARVFGSFEANFLENLAEYLPADVPCFWTGPSVVSKSIKVTHLRSISRRLRQPLILWDNYPVNDLAMKDEMHLSPLTGRDPRLPDIAYGYLTNPLLQETLSFIPLATCFDYASNPAKYEPERSWTKIVAERFGRNSLPYWRAIRSFCEKLQIDSRGRKPAGLLPREVKLLQAAYRYLQSNRNKKWARELRPWSDRMAEILQS
jgi:hyaluronoglucosaminidase